MVERGLARETMERRCHPPREPLGLPHAAKAYIRVFVQPLASAALIVRLQGTREHQDIRRREIQALGAGRRNDVSSIRSEEHTSELQSQSNLVCRLLLEKKKKKKQKQFKKN